MKQFFHVLFLIKLKVLAYNFIKKRLWHRCFSVNVTEFLTILTGKNCVLFNSVQEWLVQEHLFLQQASGGCFFNSKNFARFPLTVIGNFFSSNMYISLFYGDNFFVCDIIWKILYILVVSLHGCYNVRK